MMKWDAHPEGKTLNPKCINNDIALAITNRGDVIPCCRCDDPLTMSDPEFQKLVKASNLDDHDSIDDIVNSEPWEEFYFNLKNNRGPKACWGMCVVEKDYEERQVVKWVDPEGNMKTLSVK